MIYTNNEEYIIFTHIPRTAGRIIDMNMVSSGYLPIIPANSFIDGIEFFHSSCSTHEKILNEIESSDKIVKKFSVVRNPITRFFSGIARINQFFYHDIQVYPTNKIYPYKEISDLLDYENFYNFMERDFLTAVITLQNYNAPAEFLFNGFTNHPCKWHSKLDYFLDSNEIKLWKYENKFGDEFEEWMNDEVGIKNFRMLESNQFKLDGVIQRYDTIAEKMVPELKELFKCVEKYYEEDLKFWKDM